MISSFVPGSLPAARLLPSDAGRALAAQDAPGGTVTVAHIGDVDNYDPLTDALDQFQNYGRLLIFGSLTTYDADSALVGDLATEWELDGTAWIFTPRDGVTWLDGSPFTADDVKYTFERVLDPEVGSFAVLTIDTIEGYPDLNATASIWQDGLKQAGVTATTTIYEINTWLDRWLNGEYQLSTNFDINGPDPQRMFTADYLLHIGNEEWGDTELAQKVEELAAAAIATVEQEERKTIYAELQTLLHDELPMIPMYHPAMIAAASSGLRSS